jgi:hypothetical protein
MPFSMLLDDIIGIFKDHLLITIALAIVLLYLLFQKPRTFLLFVFLVLLFTGISYLITRLPSGNISIWK